MYVSVIIVLNRLVIFFDMLDIFFKFKVIFFFLINVLSYKKLNLLLVVFLKGK